jgi:hypothetical protein
MSGNDAQNLPHLTVDDIAWNLPPLDSLMFDGDTQLLADTLRTALLRVVSINRELASTRRTVTPGAS